MRITSNLSIYGNRGSRFFHMEGGVLPVGSGHVCNRGFWYFRTLRDRTTDFAVALATQWIRAVDLVRHCPGVPGFSNGQDERQQFLCRTHNDACPFRFRRE
ncbi:hypothetical protein GLUCOINTEAF2_0202516 [Komagataeibacter intermedius AF2]|uniref:Uncharacterized protein n=1 Tax=Komagataeibacter intermedius AF2 TaxID=1458464 RepID=A0A0N1F9Q1_9PROT|nr:hypothetical protein GLUCOINTEAF2_0202516 [Komagataeibacter intermedius AF2]